MLSICVYDMRTVIGRGRKASLIDKSLILLPQDWMHGDGEDMENDESASVPPFFSSFTNFLTPVLPPCKYI